MRILIFTLFLALSSFPAHSSGSDPASDAPAFCRSFREAVLDHDCDRVASMTEFPLEVRGPSDSDPVRRYSRKAFPVIFQQILDQPVSLVSGGMIATKTMLEVIREKQEISAKDVKNGNMLRIQQLQFRRVHGKWLLIRTYLEPF